MAGQKGDKQRAIKEINSACEDAVARAIRKIQNAQEDESVINSARTSAINKIRHLAEVAVDAVKRNKRVLLKSKKVPGTRRLSDMVNTIVANACKVFNQHLDNYFG